MSGSKRLKVCLKRRNSDLSVTTGSPGPFIPPKAPTSLGTFKSKIEALVHILLLPGPNQSELERIQKQVSSITKLNDIDTVLTTDEQARYFRQFSTFNKTKKAAYEFYGSWRPNTTADATSTSGLRSDRVKLRANIERFSIFIAMTMAMLEHVPWIAGSRTEETLKTHLIHMSDLVLKVTINSTLSIGAYFRQRLALGLATETQLGLLKIAMEAYVRDVKTVLFRDCWGGRACGKCSTSRFARGLGGCEHVKRMRTEVEEEVRKVGVRVGLFVIFVVRLRAESVESRIWRYIHED